MITIFSILWTIINCCAMAFVIYFIRTRTDVISKYGCFVISFLTVCCILRILFPIEFPEYQFIIPDSILYSKILEPVQGLLHPKIPEWLLSLLLVIWFSGSAFHTIRLIYKSVQVSKRLKSCSREAGSDIVELLHDIDADCPLKIYLSSDISVPVLAGYFHPAIYIPDDLREEYEYRYILLHEYTHWKRKDILKKLFMNFVCVIAWWNPAVYIIRREVSQIIEFSCDRQLSVRLSDYEIVEYLEVLRDNITRIKRSRIKTNTYTIEFVNTSRRYSIIQRFQLLLQRDMPSRRSPVPKIILIVISCIWMACSYYFILQPNYITSDNLLWKQDYQLDDYVINISDTGNTYLKEQKDGSYIMYYNNTYTEFSMPVSREDVEAGLYELYPIIPYEEETFIERLLAHFNNLFH